MRKNEDGYIVVETTIAFMLFAFLVISILSLINIVTVQTRVHYALTQTANELSMYSYVIDVLGLTSDIKGLDETGKEVQEKIDGVINDLNTIETGVNSFTSDTEKFFDNMDALVETIERITEAGKSLSGTAKEVVQDPKGTFVALVRAALDKTKNLAVQEVVMRPMIEKYLANGDQTAEEFLKAYRINNKLDLSDSVFIDSNGDITVVASYDIDYTFGLLPLPAELSKIHVKQTAKTRAWLGGAD